MDSRKLGERRPSFIIRSRPVSAKQHNREEIMKKLISILLAVSMILTLAVTASAFFEPEEAFGEVKFSIG